MTKRDLHRRIESLCGKYSNVMNVYIVDEYKTEVSVNVDWGAECPKEEIIPLSTITNIVKKRMTAFECKKYLHSCGFGGTNIVFHTPLDENYVRALELVCYDIAKQIKPTS